MDSLCKNVWTVFLEINPQLTEDRAWVPVVASASAHWIILNLCEWTEETIIYSEA